MTFEPVFQRISEALNMGKQEMIKEKSDGETKALQSSVCFISGKSLQKENSMYIS